MAKTPFITVVKCAEDSAVYIGKSLFQQYDGLITVEELIDVLEEINIGVEYVENSKGLSEYLEENVYRFPDSLTELEGFLEQD